MPFCTYLTWENLSREANVHGRSATKLYTEPPLRSLSTLLLMII